jgi:F-type H+-transporting ATPase subunit epsilon
MAATLQFDLVSPERRLASIAATEVQIPATDGDMAAMPGHAPVITTLRPGVLRAISADGVKAYMVTGGFAEITATGISVLAEQAVPLEEMTPAIMDQMVADATLAGAVNPDKDAADKVVADLLALRAVPAH